jgi:hypothetical protein
MNIAGDDAIAICDAVRRLCESTRQWRLTTQGMSDAADAFFWHTDQDRGLPTSIN